MFLHRNAKWIAAISGVLFIPISSTAQVTRGQKPDLPQPFATKSAGNGPNKSQAPQGFSAHQFPLGISRQYFRQRL